MSEAEEEARLAMLRRLAILDTEPEPAFDALVRLATAAFSVRSALISLVDRDRQWFKARACFEAKGSPRDIAFCHHALLAPGEALVVLDARADPRFSANPLVTGAPFIRFYAGAPVVLDGHALGTLCLIDPEPRADFGPDRREALMALAATVEQLLQQRLERAEGRLREEALEVATRQTILAEELGGVGHWSREILTGRVKWSRQVYRIHGVDPGSFTPGVDDAMAFYEPESRARIQAAMQCAVQTGRGFDFKARLHRASDGATRTVVGKGELTAAGEDGGPVLFGVFQDVTEQEELLHQVEAERERYRLLTQNATDVIATYGLDAVFTYVSPAIERMAGMTAESLIGRRTYDIIHPDDHRRVHREFRAFVESGGESARIEYRIAPAAGEPFRVEAHPSPVRDDQGRVVGFQDVVRDVSERRAAEAAARESEQRYRLLAENANDMIALTSPGDSTIRFVSPGCRRVLGYEPEELVGRATLSLTHPDDRAEVVARFTRLVAAGPTDAVSPYQFRGRHKDGSWIWLEGQPRVQFDPLGTPLFFQDVVRDVTQRKQLEVHLEAARDAAEAATRAKSDFLANMSHELRTPLTGILGYADVLAASPELGADSRRHAQLIGRSGRTLLGLVNDVLDLSKIEAGGLELAPQPTDLPDLLASALDAVRPQAEAKGLALHADLPSAPEVAVDPDRLRQVAINLLGNAVKFTEAGEVRLTLTVRPASAGRVAVEVAVADTGIGIPEDQLARIFGRFEQADGSITRRFGGTGLGLSISRSIAERMGGGLEARSEPGRGSVFTATLELPLAAAAAAQPAEARADGVSRLAGLRVLLAEDVAMNRELIALFLGKHGVALTAVENGAEAVEAAAGQAFDAILMDMQMPVMDGLEAARRIRAGGGPTAAAPILALTANVLASETAACRAAGMDGHIGKPFTAEDLALALESALQDRAAKAA